VLKIVNKSLSFGVVATQVIDIRNVRIWQENCLVLARGVRLF
jgi:hypothetical protein